MIRHVVMWKYETEDAHARAEHIARFRQALASLPAEIPEILSLQLAENELYHEANWHFSLLADFADAEALARYQSHPAHLATAAVNQHLAAARAAIDYTV